MSVIQETLKRHKEALTEKGQTDWDAFYAAVRREILAWATQGDVNVDQEVIDLDTTTKQQLKYALFLYPAEELVEDVEETIAFREHLKRALGGKKVGDE